MENWQRGILILTIVLLAISMPHAMAQMSPQLSLSLVGQTTGQYITPAGQTTELKMEILNEMRQGVYLLQGDAYLDTDLSGTWALIHSEQLGSFHLGFLQSAIWTFDLAVPANIRATNVSNGTPQADLLIKITYEIVAGARNMEQRIFALGVPGATVQQYFNEVWYVLAGVLVLVGIGITFAVATRRRRQ
jgi:hypothetical protein